MLVFKVLSLQDLLDFAFAVMHGNFVREIRGEHERFGPYSLNGIGESLLVSLAAHKDPAAAEIFLGLFLQELYQFLYNQQT